MSMGLGRLTKWTSRLWRAGSLMLVLSVTGTGCVVWRGVDFGHWARTGEKITLVKAFRAPGQLKWKGDEQILVLPPQGADIEPSLMALIGTSLMVELRHCLPVNVMTLAEEDVAGEILDKENLVVAGSVMDAREAARLADLVEATHVVMVYVQEFRPYPPQKLALRLTLVDVAAQKPTVSLDAVLDAREQQVVMALAEHLQSRRARRFDAQSLDVMLQSPTEFSAFVSARCAEAMAQALSFEAGFKRGSLAADRGR